jgi:hypothetical protein
MAGFHPDFVSISILLLLLWRTLYSTLNISAGAYRLCQGHLVPSSHRRCLSAGLPQSATYHLTLTRTRSCPAVNTRHRLLPANLRITIPHHLPHPIPTRKPEVTILSPHPHSATSLHHPPHAKRTLKSLLLRRTATTTSTHRIKSRSQCLMQNPTALILGYGVVGVLRR